MRKLAEKQGCSVEELEEEFKNRGEKQKQEEKEKEKTKAQAEKGEE